jgi:predicted nucleic acid-binding Zn ribbon protein
MQAAENDGRPTIAVEYPMPLFEYECRGCGNHFEYLTRMGVRPLSVV